VSGASGRPRVVFRCDASAGIGGGHVMRCLTLARELSERGAKIAFACALIPEFLAARVVEAGFALHRIGPGKELPDRAERPDHAVLSPAAQRADAERTLAVGGAADWVVVDHYRLSAEWLERVGGERPRRLAIDDLANRRQECEILVDQTFGRTAADYRALVPERCRVLAGSQYAMLRPEFRALRPAALDRREQAGPVRRLLISLGSTDLGGITAAVLEAARSSGVTMDIDVVVGAGAASLAAIQAAAAAEPSIRVHVDSREMAPLIAQADLAIGAAGTSSWERCCLGLPTIALVLADNQRLVAQNLERAGAIVVADSPQAIPALLQTLANDQPARLAMVAAAAAIVDGEGALRVAGAMIAETVHG
jgi:UDP-2,4-diacetamido-2,4,6-trideoxy-beta-L-altropyranose hydrolase